MARPLRLEFTGAVYHITSRGDRRDNSPNTAGEIDNTTATSTKRGKISCMEQRLSIRGVHLADGLRHPSPMDPQLLHAYTG